MKAGKYVKIFWYLEILPRLGIWNVLYVLFYRWRLRSGYYERKNPVYEPTTEGAFFAECNQVRDFPLNWKKPLLKQADHLVNGSIPYFSHHWMEQSSPPDWFLNPFNGQYSRAAGNHWSRIPDFDSHLGDIKCIWETSRFSWLGILARAYVVSGKGYFLSTLNSWLDDWIRRNPANQGPNWKCGQETSFRVIALLNTAHILKQADKPTARLAEMVRLHLDRISSTIRYGMSQRNNHASSEAAALFIGGNWLLKVNDASPGRRHDYAGRGRRLLEQIMKSLTYEDGSFSQHSVVYHRLFLDTITNILFWSSRMELRKFSPGFYQRARRVKDWLHALLDESGNCPNLGPNDGTMLLSNHSCEYRDFRPSLQLASVLLNDKLIFRDGPYNEVLFWYGLSTERDPETGNRFSRIFSSGYVVMKGSESWALLRFPYFRFRPSHNDALHFDLWAGGRNVLFDSGSYSYNPPPENTVPDLKSVHAHNTLSFDGREQMPRLGRFLLAKWLKPHEVGKLIIRSENAGNWKGSYKDSAGNMHEREVSWGNNSWEILDRFMGEADQVELGFNFHSCDYRLDKKANRLLLPWGSIQVSEHARIAVQHHMVSNYYMEAKECFRLCISSRNNKEVTSTIEVHS